MTLFCPLNQPQCKRSIMTATGPFEKKECPLSKNRKCPFAPPVCPMFPQQEDECYWPKIQGVMDQGGCKVKPNPMSQLAAQCCKVQKAQMQNPAQRSYPPANCAELPPCVRCSFGHPEPKEGDDKSTRNTKKKKESVNSSSPAKDEDTKQFASPKPDRNPSLQSRKNHLSGGGKNENRKKKTRSGISTLKTNEVKVKIAAGKTGKGYQDGKTEDVKVQKAARHPSKKAAVTEQRTTAPEKREEIFRKAVYDKVGKLQNRDHLVVPQCSSASRRIMPCTACLLDLLGTTAQISEPVQTSGTDGTEERCRLERIMATCTAFRVPSVCPKGCPCTEVPLLEDEEVEDDCPFLQHLPTSVPPRGCPLSRLPDHPFVLDGGRTSDRGAAPDPCKCPIIPGDCCYTLPGCPVHTMRAVIDCPSLNKK